MLCFCFCWGVCCCGRSPWWGGCWPEGGATSCAPARHTRVGNNVGSKLVPCVSWGVRWRRRSRWWSGRCVGKSVGLELVSCCFCWGGCWFGFGTWWARVGPGAKALSSNWFVVVFVGAGVALGLRLGGHVGVRWQKRWLPIGWLLLLLGWLLVWGGRSVVGWPTILSARHCPKT